MQLSPDTSNIDEAIEELQAVLTLEVLRINLSVPQAPAHEAGPHPAANRIAHSRVAD
jgi:hypothetical protein